MGKFGLAAVRAEDLYRQGTRPIDRAWEVAAGEVFVDAPESRRKSCPRGAFLGLCRAGLVRGVSPTRPDSLEEGANAKYAVTAAHLLAADPTLAAAGPTKLWKRVMEELGLSSSKKHNQQMDVVLSLWSADSLAVAKSA